MKYDTDNSESANSISRRDLSAVSANKESDENIENEGSRISQSTFQFLARPVCSGRH